MKERPILFSGAMVRAILDGRKTQTRRVVKWPVKTPQNLYGPTRQKGGRYGGSGLFSDVERPLILKACPYGQPGERLWVRETFAVHPEDSSFLYRCDRGGDYQGAAQGDFKWKPSIFCTRRASRITLEIVKVRVERLQDITEEDAKAEGCESGIWDREAGVLAGETDPEDVATFRDGYGFLWECINGSGSWTLNPWVWVVEFKRGES